MSPFVKRDMQEEYNRKNIIVRKLRKLRENSSHYSIANKTKYMAQTADDTFLCKTSMISKLKTYSNDAVIEHPKDTRYWHDYMEMIRQSP